MNKLIDLDVLRYYDNKIKALVDAKNVYSTSEQVIGKLDNGKLVYRKEFYVDSVNANTIKRIDYAVSSLERTVDLRGFNNIENSNYEVPINFFNIMQLINGETPNGQYCFIDKRQGIIEFYSTWNVYNLKITLEYKKSTDTV